MKISFEIEEALHHEKEELSKEDEIEITKECICEGFRIPEEVILNLKIEWGGEKVEKEMTLKECNDYIKSIGLYPLGKMIEVTDCKICGEQVNVRNLMKHLKNKHFDIFYKIVMGLK